MPESARPAAVERMADLFPLTERGWLAGQPDEVRDWAARSGRWREFETHQVLYDAGEDSDGLYGLAHGTLEITMPLSGAEPITLYRAEPGFWIGDSALLAQTPRIVSVSAAERTRVFFIPAAAVRDSVIRWPEFWRAFYQLSHINIMTAVTLLAEALSLPPSARLARTIARLSDTGGAVRASQGDLARVTGMTRSTLQRSLAELVAAGAIETGYRSLAVRDRAALDRIAGKA